jgi:16S rRNA (uracil1498-N3)-methyltransferase
MDIVIQKATELGVHSITPLFSANCAVKLTTDRADKRLEHWQRIAVSACEQSGRTQLPLIHPPISLSAWINQPFEGISLYGDTQAGSSVNNLPRMGAYRMAVGPESGWHINETKHLQEGGFIACTLGPRILRTETAGLVGISLLQGLFGDLSVLSPINK